MIPLPRWKAERNGERSSSRDGRRRVRARRVKTIILVSCCGEKLQHPAPAKELYQSNLFRLARRYAESQASRSQDVSWVILSALLGVVHPDQVVEPYEQRMWTKRARWNSWATGVQKGLLNLAGDEPARFVSLCGSKYEVDVTGHIMERPLAGMGIGQRLQWLKQQLQKAA